MQSKFHSPSNASAQGEHEQIHGFSSAGLKTQRLAAQQQASAPFQEHQASTPSVSAPPAPRTAGLNLPNNRLALALIAIGGILLFGQMAPSGGAMAFGMVLLTLASCFLFFSFWKQLYGLLIPGCIIGGLGVGVAFASVTGGAAIFWGLALGFLAILLVGRRMFNKPHQWPIYPAIPLFAVGVMLALLQLPGILAGSLIWLPLLLIGIGLYLGFGGKK